METAPQRLTTYSRDAERRLDSLYRSLSEQDRRRYAAVEAKKLGHSGVVYVAAPIECDADTIRQGQQDIEQLPGDAAAGRVGQKGGT